MDIESEQTGACCICLQSTTELLAVATEYKDPKLQECDPDLLFSELQSRGAIISKHFWFEIGNHSNALVCSQCWTKIEDFHQFYHEIELIHQRVNQFIFTPVKLENDKSETLFVNDGQRAEISEIINTLIEDQEAIKVKEANIEKQKKPYKKRKIKAKSDRPRKAKLTERIAEDDQLISKYINAICDSCFAHFATFTELQSHSLASHQRRAYVFCCDKKYNQRTRLYEHVLLHVNPEHYQCDICKRNCLDSESLRRHKLKIHTPEEQRSFKCEKCPKAFAAEGDLILHKNYHTAIENKEFQCDQCEKCFGNHSLLKSHVRNAHALYFEFVCDTCAKGFNQRSLFVKHLQEHNPTKEPVERSQCPHCSRWMKKNYLNKHIQRHSSPITRCDLCGKESPNVFAHRSHMRFAHSEPKFLCTVCGKAFRRALNLKEHLASHSGAMLYTCPHCPKTFNSNANMHSHRKKMHYQEWLANKERVLIIKG
ncbi:transcription factor grauzone-like [Wyeomyia smithii]|uniref:transcription factor grauzone-like n=1 Tax=Wyeomyia smithii TaxID=174621 RepID=UPI002467DD6A|nr:transcription factor grauzone-like [Wyeomyia smithii]